jgi:eukaryotic-like serine/threonine-protein kinase
MTPGTRLGPYEILAPIGAGGMGEVYKARDTRLDRIVALKISRREFTERFDREARAVAALNHPHICQLYDVGPNYLVMEYVEGKPITGPLPIDQALEYSAQICDALDAAHRKGIVHRDLKPGNILVGKAGVKILDFGLARMDRSPGPDDVTAVRPITQEGTLLGTLQYMSPEQLEGREADARSDIFGFGIVLYEMISGTRPFTGTSTASLIAAILKEQPRPLTELKPITPPALNRVVGTCLEKDAEKRWQSAREVEHALKWIEGESPAPAVASRGVRRWQAAFAAMALIAAGVIAALWLRPSPSLGVVRFSFPPPENHTLLLEAVSVAVSPDGRHVAFEARAGGGKRELWVRDLESSASRMLAEIGAFPEMPFWAPDSRRLGFFDGSKLEKIDITGGPPVTIADTGVNQVAGSGSWNQDDVIIFGSAVTPLFRVPAAGGKPVPLMELDKARGEFADLLPDFLPDGRHFLYSSIDGDPGKVRVRSYLGDLGSRMRKPVPIGSGRAIYTNGYLLFLRDRALMAQRFDTGKLETTGDAVAVAEAVYALGGDAGYFSASQNGVLMYTSGGAIGNVQLTWFDHSGRKLDTAGAPGDLEYFSLSPDNETVAFTRKNIQTLTADIWTRDLTHGSESRLTFAGDNGFPVWSADGKRLFFFSTPLGGPYKIYEQAANGIGAKSVVEADFKLPEDASRDGRYLIASTPIPGSSELRGGDIWVLPLFGDRKPFPYVATEFLEGYARLSPDGHWLAYESNESNRFEVYVVSFPEPGGKWQISTGGGGRPVWRRDGRELYYYSLDGKIMAVDIKPGAQFQFGAPKPLFAVNLATNNLSFDVSKDGRFLLPVVVEQQGSAVMNVVLNWPEMLKKK